MRPADVGANGDDPGAITNADDGLSGAAFGAGRARTVQQERSQPALSPSRPNPRECEVSTL